MDDNYEMVPYKDILELKQELEELKASGNPEMINSMKQLTALLGEFTAVLKEASKGMSEESSGSIKSISSKLDTIMQQNEKIADALAAVADMLDNTKPREQVYMPIPQAPMQPMQSSQQMPPIIQPREPGRTLPEMEQFGFGNPPEFQRGMPEFPPAGKRRGLFGRFKK